MKIRFLYCSALFIILLLRLAGSVSAEEVNTQRPKLNTESSEPAISKAEAVAETASNTAVKSKLELKATVAEGFKQTILLNFTTADQENVMARLDKVNGYVFSQETKPGTYKVEFINIVGENATDYNIKAPKQVVIKKGIIARFDVQVSLKPTAQQSVEKAPIAEPVQHIPGITVSPNAINPDLTLQISTAKGTPLPAANLEDPQKFTATIDASAYKSIIGFAIVLLLVLLIFLYKKVSYKHDYYDC